MNDFNSSKKFNNRLIILVILGAVLIAGFLGIRAMVSDSSKSSQTPMLREALKKKDVNKDFAFAIKDDTGKEVTKINYKIENVELRDQILVAGKSASSIAGKKFLVLNIKLNNTYNKPIQLTAKDYVRLTVNKSSELVAPDIHNDPVTIQPLSTKETRIGFAIKDSDKNLTLKVGEINGPKTDIEVNF
ncbi:MAG: hypothetical protein AABY22_19130 [Nanoarchaeota archaeon]